MKEQSTKAVAKKKFFKMVFSRAGIFVILILVQMLIFLGIPYYLKEYATFIYSVMSLMEIIVLVYIINTEGNPAFKLSWILCVMAVPVVGTIFYIYVHLQLETRFVQNRLAALRMETEPYMDQDQKITDALWEGKSANAQLSYYLSHQLGFPTYRNTEAEYFPVGEAKFASMIKELEKAEKFIFMEYFIVAKSYMWNTILEILKEKAAQGVEVRMMYDGMCSLALLPYGYYKDLEKMGIQSIPFSQIRPVLSTYQNNRDHRKILIIDGKTVFTGGINLADEYINRIDRFGHWKDTAVMIQGEAVKIFTLLFLKMWHVAKGKDSIPEEEIRKYTVEVWENTQADEMRADMESMRNTDMQNTQDKKLHAGGYVIPYGDDPYGDERIGKQVYIDILNRARKYVHIMTPYLILDDEMITALRYCAKRGVETVIIMPHIPDKIYAYLLARTYYKQLLKYGVKIYEYTPGFVHAKVFVSDDIRGCVGTINLDFRSLYLHFECGAYMYSNDVLHDVEQDFKETLKQCQEITKESCDKYPKGKMLVGKMLRLIAPLM